MAGTTSSIISNLLSSLERLSQFMPTSTSLAASSSSSIAQEDVTVAEVNSIQKRLLEDLSRLSRMLQRIQAVLLEAEEREIYDKAIQLWLNELREVAYDAEDILDQYDYEVIKTQLEGMAAIAEAKPSLKRKQVDDNDIYGYEENLEYLCGWSPYEPSMVESNNQWTVLSSDWRSQLQPVARQRIVNKIMDTLRRHMPLIAPEGMAGLKKIALRFEEKIYAAAANQSDYLRKISVKMLSMETKTQKNTPMC